MKKKLLGLMFLNAIFLGNIFGAHSLLILNKSNLDIRLRIENMSKIPINLSTNSILVKKNGHTCFSGEIGKNLSFSFIYERITNIRPVDRTIFFEEEKVPEFGKLFVFKDGFIALLDENRKKNPIYVHLKVALLAGNAEVIYLNENDFVAKLEKRGYKKTDLFNVTEQEKTKMNRMIERKGCD